MINLQAVDKRKILLCFLLQFFLLFKASPLALAGHLVPLLWVRHNIRLPWRILLRDALPLWVMIFFYTLAGGLQLHAPFFKVDTFASHLARQASFMVVVPYSVLLTRLITGRDLRLIISWFCKPLFGEKQAANLGLALALSYHFMPRVEQLWAKHDKVLRARGLVKPRLKKWLLTCKLTITSLFLTVEQKNDAILSRGYQEKMPAVHWQHTSCENLLIPSLLSYSYVVEWLFKMIASS